MKFSSVFFLAGLVTASPFIREVQPRGDTVIGTVVDTINEIVTTGEEDLKQIGDVIETIKTSTGASLEAGIEILKEDIKEVTDAIKQASDAISKATADAADKIAKGLEEIAQEELEIFAEAVDALSHFAAEVEAVISIGIKGLGPAAQKLVQAEVAALEAVLKPFVAPVVAFIKVLKDVGVAIGLEVSVLVKAGQGFTTVLAHFLQSLGLNLLPTPKVGV